MTASGQQRTDERSGAAAGEERGPRTRVRRWGARELVAGWILYWIALVLVVAWPQLLAYVKVVTSPSGHGSISWSYSGSILAAALWIAGPPLLMAAVWIATRPPRR